MKAGIKKTLFVFLTIMCYQNLRITSADYVLESIPNEKMTVTSETILKSNFLLDPTEKTDNTINDKKSLTEIKQNDKPLETHNVVTEDGYVLTLNRIPGPLGSLPVLLQHGLLGCAEEWLVAGVEKSFAYILRDNGWDVWLGNIRGSTLSKSHETLTPSDPQFWNFTWHEQGIYDLPAMINYINRLTNESLFYVGHSMGATTFSVMAIERPEVAKNVKAMIGLAPAPYVHHMKSPIKLISPFWNVLKKISNTLGIYEFFPRHYLFDTFSKYVCESVLLRSIFCSNTMFLIGGFNSDQLDYDQLPQIWSIFPAGTSIKLYTHWMQQIAVNEFRKFDYGADDNMRIYNSSEPPNYDISQIQVPVAIFWSANDWLVAKEDVYHYYEQLSFKLGIYEVEDKLFNHFDFLWGKNAPELLYSNVLKVMTDYKNKIVRD